MNAPTTCERKIVAKGGAACGAPAVFRIRGHQLSLKGRRLDGIVWHYACDACATESEAHGALGLAVKLL